MTRRTAAINARVEANDDKRAADWAGIVRRALDRSTPDEIEAITRNLLGAIAYRARQSERRRNRSRQ